MALTADIDLVSKHQKHDDLGPSSSCVKRANWSSKILCKRHHTYSFWIDWLTLVHPCTMSFLPTNCHYKMRLPLKNVPSILKIDWTIKRKHSNYQQPLFGCKWIQHEAIHHWMYQTICVHNSLPSCSQERSRGLKMTLFTSKPVVTQRLLPKLQFIGYLINWNINTGFLLDMMKLLCLQMFFFFFALHLLSVTFEYSHIWNSTEGENFSSLVISDTVSLSYTHCHAHICVPRFFLKGKRNVLNGIGSVWLNFKFSLSCK